jgi:TonB family protein
LRNLFDICVYARALLAGAGLEWSVPPRPASAWLRARHLRARIQAIINGGPMSKIRVVGCAIVLGTTLTAAGYGAVSAFPLQNSGGQRGARVYDSKEEGVTLPRIVREVKPQYTQAAMDAHIQGAVMLAIVVEPDGTPGDVRITRSLDPMYGLDEEAVKAARQWRFRAGTKDGKPVAVRIEIELTFTLK